MFLHCLAWTYKIPVPALTSKCAYFIGTFLVVLAECSKKPLKKAGGHCPSGPYLLMMSFWNSSRTFFKSSMPFPSIMWFTIALSALVM